MFFEFESWAFSGTPIAISAEETDADLAGLIVFTDLTRQS